MLRYIICRVLYPLPVIWLVVSTVFLLIHFVPGDPIQQMLGEGAAAGDIQAARHAYGLDVPLGEQYLNYWRGVLHGDLGKSLRFNHEVTTLIAHPYPFTFAHLVPPAITMGGALAAILTRMVRTSMLEELGQDYIRTARAKGLPERTVVYRHALRNAMIPILTVLGLQFGALLAGAIVTETIFSWPGIGRLTIQAIANRDYYLVQGCILAIGLTYVAVNFLTDLLYSAVNPRIRQ